MLWKDLSKNWKTYRPQFKTKWPKLTEADLDEIKGNRTTCLKKLENRLHLKKMDAEHQLDDFVEHLKPMAAGR